MNVCTAALLGVALLGLAGCGEAVASTPPPYGWPQANPTPAPTPTPSWYDGPVHQLYWYCWNSGAPSPHHLGHPVLGDHLCTDAELNRPTPAPTPGVDTCVLEPLSDMQNGMYGISRILERHSGPCPTDVSGFTDLSSQWQFLTTTLVCTTRDGWDVYAIGGPDPGDPGNGLWVPSRDAAQRACDAT